MNQTALPLYIIGVWGMNNFMVMLKKLCKLIFSKKFILKLLKGIIEFFIILALWEAFLYLIFLIISMRPLKL